MIYTPPMEGWTDMAREGWGGTRSEGLGGIGNGGSTFMEAWGGLK